MTKYTRFEAIFRNETLVFTDRDPKFRNRLDVYNYICAERLGKKFAKWDGEKFVPCDKIGQVKEG